MYNVLRVSEPTSVAAMCSFTLSETRVPVVRPSGSWDYPTSGRGSDVSECGQFSSLLTINVPFQTVDALLLTGW